MLKEICIDSFCFVFVAEHGLESKLSLTAFRLVARNHLSAKSCEIIFLTNTAITTGVRATFITIRRPTSVVTTTTRRGTRTSHVATAIATIPTSASRTTTTRVVDSSHLFGALSVVLGDRHAHDATANILVVQMINGLLSFALVFKLNKGEASLLTTMKNYRCTHCE